MKKLLLVVFILALLCGSAYAITPVYEGATGMGDLRTVILVNASGDQASTFLSTAAGYIVPGKVRIVGVSVNDTKGGASTEVYVSLADAIATSGDADTLLMSELEAATSYSIDKVFPLRGLSIQKGLAVRQGAWTCVTIYYVQVLP